ncbi:PAS domain-containing sensor histidine kinase [Nisaea denitrificans]|uniref:PAS domain-containing sensor histidine kinase n=1 Tax=Nisaea denitrificans TaxID=390877 RepID=UPI000416AE57|nr:PAS domain S-box protein [Nisaea denitrificans]
MDSPEAAEPHSAKAEDYFFEWRCDRDGTTTTLSDNFETLTGLNPVALSKFPLLGCSESMEQALAVWGEHALRGEAFHNFSLTISDGTGQCRVLLSGKGFPAGAARPEGFSGFGSCVGVREASPYRQPEPADESLFERIKDVGKAGYILHDAATGHYRIVGPLQEIISPGLDAVSAEDIRAGLLASDIERFDALWGRSRGECVSEEVELRFGRDLYDCRHFLFYLEPYDEDAVSRSGLFAVYRDVTEHRGAETTLKQVEKIASVGHWYSKASIQETYWSEALRDIFGIADWSGEVRTRNYFWDNLVHPEDAPVYLQEREAGIREKRDYGMVVRAHRLDGRMLWVQINGHPLFDRVGSLIGTMGTIQDITPLKELEGQVLQRDKWFKRAQRLGGIGHWTFERAERCIHLSEQAQEIFGTDGVDRFTFAEARKRIHPDDHELLQVIQQKIGARGSGFERQVRVFRADGSIAHLLIAGEFDFSERGELERTFGTIADVSSQVAAEEARRDAEALMSDVFENADCGIVVRDLSDRFIRVNTRAAIQLGLRINDMLGHTVEEVIAKCDRMEDAELMTNAADKVVATLGAVTYDYSHRTGNSERATEFRVVNFPIAGRNSSVRAVASMRYDITDFVNAQDALKKLNEGLESTVRARTLELRHSEERFRNIASASADWLWELDADLNFIWCSENFFEATGRKREDYLGKSMIALVTDEERLVDQRDVWSTFLGKLEAREQVRGIEIERHHPTGIRTVRINAMPVWSDGEFIGFHGSTADISELKQTQAQLIETDRLASLGGLVAGISHEINTPVGASFTVVTKLIATLADLQDGFLKGKISQSQFSRFLAEMDEGLGIIHRGLERTAELITHFKQVAVDQTSLKRREFELSETVSDIVTTMAATIGRRSVKIETQVPEGIRLDSYPGPLGQVLINLIQNAIFHGFDEDGVKKDEAERIVVAGKFGRSGTVTLSVTDNGKGMSPQVVRRVFEPFFTTKFGSGGSGLGMHLVYSIVHGALGGTVSVSSKPGKGTVIAIMLPIIAPENVDREAAGES